MNKHTIEMLGRLQKAGISTNDALALRRIAMTLQRWFELECGDSNDHASRCIVRGRKLKQPTKDENGYLTQFEYDDNGTPHMEVHYHRRLDPTPFYIRIPDRETGARKRLAKIMARYPGFSAYVQTDPRGASLYANWPNPPRGTSSLRRS